LDAGALEPVRGKQLVELRADVASGVGAARFGGGGVQSALCLAELARELADAAREAVEAGFDALCARGAQRIEGGAGARQRRACAEGCRLAPGAPQQRLA